MINLKEYTLGECIICVIDHRGKTPTKMGGEWTDSGVRVFSALNVHEGNIDNEDQIRCVSDEVYRRWMPDDIKRNDCLIVSEGYPGESLLWDSDEKIVLGQRLYAVRVNPRILDPWYFAGYMQTNKFRKQINQISTGSTVFGISQKELLKVKLLLPDISEQKKIGTVYKLLKRCVENNNAIIAELESMAKTIYDYWFLQFEFPNEEGKPYKSSGGKMVWNEELKREIPEGWSTITLGEITRCHDADRVPLSGRERENMKGNIPYYGATGIMDYVDRPIFDGDYVLIAEDGSVMDEFGHPILQRVHGKTWINNHAHVLEPTEAYSCKLLMMLLKDVSVSTIKTGSIQMKITQDNLNKIKLPNIPLPLLHLMNNYLCALDQKIISIEWENRELTSLCDFLLPLLMNGQVGFKDE